MTRNHLCCSALVFLTVFGSGGTAAVQCQWGEGCVCLQCPAGQQPTKDCGRVESPEDTVRCQSCPMGTFSNTLDPEPCRPHSTCDVLGRKVVTPGTSTSDTVCGDCVSGFHPTTMGKPSPQPPCVAPAPPAAPPLHVRAVRTVGKSAAGGGGPVNGTAVRSAEEKTAEYAVFALVPIFCVMGLLGILICNILKKKGYRCTAEKEGMDEENATPQKEANGCPYIADDPNEDTISVLVRLITEKKENAAALEELLLEYESKQLAMSKASSIKFPVLSPLSQFHSLPRMCPHQSHLHTISGLSGLASRHGYHCSRCAQRKWPPILLPTWDPLKPQPPQSLILPSLEPQALQKSPLQGGVCVDTPPKCAQSQGEVGQAGERRPGGPGGTFLSVGRFQVAQIPEQKPVAMETPRSRTTRDVTEEKRSLLDLFSSSSSSSSSHWGT
ncbi:LOW QUALITY PROTEIN: tumor necrosis factor receptor superfamily member 19L [Hypomesus transpacificus]|uniref:LOW QUALITY PROTEIN: tumor necrosis factor receptor superfamily member 19L n=1 Tax=Hypomesus transpacificus TaxID=137520 RepID=UPI001F07347C|nr:LOW QUALITY PROTEIN: tumor necrosis factor receptor superfamily member 19L [Hypomesus transpacificus]